MERNWKGKWAVTGTINDVLCQWRRVVNGKSREGGQGGGGEDSGQGLVD